MKSARDLQQELQQNPWDLWKSWDSCKIWDYLNRRKPLNLRQIDVFALVIRRCKRSRALRGSSGK